MGAFPSAFLIFGDHCQKGTLYCLCLDSRPLRRGGGGEAGSGASRRGDPRSKVVKSGVELGSRGERDGGGGSCQTRRISVAAQNAVQVTFGYCESSLNCR